MMSRLNLLGSVQALPRDLRLLFLSLFLWTFGLGVYNYVWSIYLRNLNANPEQVGLVFSIGFVAAALSMIPGGILANKYELKTLLIVGWAMSIPPPIMFYFAGNWADVIPGIIILQVSAFNLPAMNAYIGAIGNPEKISSAYGTVYSAAPLGIVFSPVVGSALLAFLSIRDLFWVALVLFTISTLVLFWVKRQPPLSSDSESPLLEPPRNSFEARILVFLAGATLAFSISSPFLPLYFQDALKLNPSQIQLLGAVQSFGSAVFTFLLGKLAVSRGQGKSMALGLLFVSAGVAGIALTGSPLLVLPMVFLFGGARSSSPVAYSLLSKMRQGRSRAGQFGFYLTFEQFGFVIGSYLGGLLYGWTPISVLAATFASFLALSSLSWVGLGRVPVGESQVASTVESSAAVAKT